MEKQRRINTLVICGLLIVVGAMTVGFAALSQRLDIEGTATVKNAASSWNILFSNVESTKTGTGEFTTAPSINTDASSNKITFACDLAAPGDSCTVTATVKNGGTTSAKYKGYTLTVDDETVTGASKTLASGAIVTVTPATGWAADTKVLAQNDEGTFTVKMELPSTVTSLPENAEQTKITLSINFEQNS